MGTLWELTFDWDLLGVGIPCMISCSHLLMVGLLASWTTLLLKLFLPSYKTVYIVIMSDVLVFDILFRFFHLHLCLWRFAHRPDSLAQIADVDCTAGNAKSLCEKYGVQGDRMHVLTTASQDVKIDCSVSIVLDKHGPSQHRAPNMQCLPFLPGNGNGVLNVSVCLFLIVLAWGHSDM